MFGAVVKLITWTVSPLALGLALIGLACVSALKSRRGWTCFFAGSAVMWLWIWSSPWFYIWFGGRLERLYPPSIVDGLPQADAIVVLGGGMGSPTPLTCYPELNSGADRGWHAARCFRAGKAPVVIFSGVGEDVGMKRFLTDLGVPATNIVLESESKNTYENSRFVVQKLRALRARKIILVTSAWHMRRAVLNFAAAKVDVVPAACDYEALSLKGWVTPSMQMYYLPTPDVLSRTTAVCKEYIGYWAYRLYFRFAG